MRTKKIPAGTPYDDLLGAAVAYLAEQGIAPLVIGGIAIQHQPGERKHNHELVIKFTGALPERREEHDSSVQAPGPE